MFTLIQRPKLRRSISVKYGWCHFGILPYSRSNAQSATCSNSNNTTCSSSTYRLVNGLPYYVKLIVNLLIACITSNLVNYMSRVKTLRINFIHPGKE